MSAKKLQMHSLGGAAGGTVRLSGCLSVQALAIARQEI